jgi:hypothetical protein
VFLSRGIALNIIKCKFKDFTDHPLDLDKITYLDPSQWVVNIYDNGVVIGAWVDDQNRMHKRFFPKTGEES